MQRYTCLVAFVLSSLFLSVGQANAQHVIAFTVTFQTTTDDKDKDNVVTVQALNPKGAAVATGQFGRKSTWHDESTNGPFVLFFSGCDVRDVRTLRLSKSGGEGWDCRVQFRALDPRGKQIHIIDFQTADLGDDAPSSRDLPCPGR